MESRSATTPPMKPGKYKRLSAARRKERARVRPARAVPPRALVQALEKCPRRLVVHRVVRQHAGRLATIGGDMAYQGAERRLLAGEAAAAAPVDDVDVRIDLHDTGARLPARTEAAQSMEPDLRQSRHQRASHAIPRRCQHPHESPAPRGH